MQINGQDTTTVDLFGSIAKTASKLVLVCSSTLPRASVQDIVLFHRSRKERESEERLRMEQKEQRSVHFYTHCVMTMTGEQLGIDIMHERPVLLACRLVSPTGEIVPHGAAIVRVGGVWTAKMSRSVFVETCRTSVRPVEVEFDWSALQKSSV